jgi:hypothetical protein
MTDTPKKIIVDCSTGETHEIALTAQEIADLETARAQAETERQARETEEARIAALKDSAKRKLIAGEKLTADEAALLIG